MLSAPRTPRSRSTRCAICGPPSPPYRTPAAVVGGTVAASLDARDAAIRDLELIAPMVLVVVLLVLMVLLRSLVAPVVLDHDRDRELLRRAGCRQPDLHVRAGLPRLDTGVPLLSFLFLVALGVDYNIFLVTRAREEAPVHGTRDGMITRWASPAG